MLLKYLGKFSILFKIQSPIFTFTTSIIGNFDFTISVKLITNQPIVQNKLRIGNYL